MPELNEQYWNDHYQQDHTPWDAGTISTPLKEYIDQLTDKNISILIPGCGNAHEAAYLLRQGFTNLTVIDIAPALTQQLGERLAAYNNKSLRILTGNFFDCRGQFDLVLEQTFFCALDPALRKDYAAHMHALLKNNGKLAGVLFNKIFTTDGPPFGGTIEEYTGLFSPGFQICTMAPCYNSITPRAGAECFVVLQKKTASTP
jgi:methyl halide transferase